MYFCMVTFYSVPISFFIQFFSRNKSAFDDFEEIDLSEVNEDIQEPMIVNEQSEQAQIPEEDPNSNKPKKPYRILVVEGQNTLPFNNPINPIEDYYSSSIDQAEVGPPNSPTNSDTMDPQHLKPIPIYNSSDPGSLTRELNKIFTQPNSEISHVGSNMVCSSDSSDSKQPIYVQESSSFLPIYSPSSSDNDSSLVPITCPIPLTPINRTSYPEDSFSSRGNDQCTQTSEFEEVGIKFSKALKTLCNYKDFLYPLKIEIAMPEESYIMDHKIINPNSMEIIIDSTKKINESSSQDLDTNMIGSKLRVEIPSPLEACQSVTDFEAEIKTIEVPTYQKFEEMDTFDNESNCFPNVVTCGEPIELEPENDYVELTKIVNNNNHGESKIENDVSIKKQEFTKRTQEKISDEDRQYIDKVILPKVLAPTLIPVSWPDRDNGNENEPRTVNTLLMKKTNLYENIPDRNESTSVSQTKTTETKKPRKKPRPYTGSHTAIPRNKNSSVVIEALNSAKIQSPSCSGRVKPIGQGFITNYTVQVTMVDSKDNLLPNLPKEMIKIAVEYNGILHRTERFEIRKTSTYGVFEICIDLMIKLTKIIIYSSAPSTNPPLTIYSNKDLYKDRTEFKTFIRRPCAIVYDEFSDLFYIAGVHPQCRIIAICRKSMNPHLVMRDNVIRPSGLAMYGTCLIVCDNRSHQITVYEMSDARGGNFTELRTFGEIGIDDGKLHYPTQIACNPNNGHIAISDCTDERVQVFDFYGNFIGKCKVPHPKKNGERRNRALLSNLKNSTGVSNGITYNKKGEIIVTDYCWNHVYKISPDFTLKVVLLEGKSSPYEDSPYFCLLKQPLGVIEDERGDYFISNSLNDKIDVFNSKFQIQYSIPLDVTRDGMSFVKDMCIVSKHGGETLYAIDNSGKIHMNDLQLIDKKIHPNID